MEGEIRTAGADLDVTTLRRNSPYSLVCRKNSASYDRQVAQRRKDSVDITMLKGTEDTHDLRNTREGCGMVGKTAGPLTAPQRAAEMPTAFHHLLLSPA